MGVQRVGDIDINQDLAFEKVQWWTQRGGWALMVGVGVLALSGLLGHGPVSTDTVSASSGGFEIEFERFIRHRSPEQLVVEVGPEWVRDGQASVWFDALYLSGIELESLYPEPESARSGGGRFVYTFALGPEGGTVTLNIMHEAVGRETARAGIEGGPEVRFEQIVYP